MAVERRAPGDEFDQQSPDRGSERVGPVVRCRRQPDCPIGVELDLLRGQLPRCGPVPLTPHRLFGDGEHHRCRPPGPQRRLTGDEGGE